MTGDAGEAARADAAGYSGIPLVRKLGIKDGHRVALIRAPDTLEASLGVLPAGVAVRRQLRGLSDVIVAFFAREAELGRALPGLTRALDEGGGLWLAWPKRGSGVATDLSDAQVRELGLATGLVDNKVCAINATWSGLRFMRRRAERA